MSYAVVIVGLLLLVFLHELGHFLAARSVGVYAPKFYVGFPPSILRVRRGRTEYGAGALMLGGYVKLAGMFRPSGRELHLRLELPVRDEATRIGGDDAERLRNALKRLQTEDADLLRERIVEFRSVSADVGASYSRGIERTLDNAFDDTDDGAYWRARLWQRMWVIAAGPLANVIVAFVVLWVSSIFFVPVYDFSYGVDKVEKGSPAEQAGFQAGDHIERWGGSNANVDRDEFFEVIERYRGEPVTITVLRDDRRITRRLTPVEIDGERRVGVYFRETTRRVDWEWQSPVPAAGEAVSVMWAITSGTLTGLAKIVDPEARKQVTTIVGIVKLSPDVAEQGMIPRFLALISLVLAIFNLLPILPLDGGHIAFGMIEKLRRGRPLPRDVFERASIMGLAAMLLLFSVGLRNDLAG